MTVRSNKSLHRNSHCRCGFRMMFFRFIFLDWLESREFFPWLWVSFLR